MATSVFDNLCERFNVAQYDHTIHVARVEYPADKCPSGRIWSDIAGTHSVLPSQSYGVNSGAVRRDLFFGPGQTVDDSFTLLCRMADDVLREAVDDRSGTHTARRLIDWLFAQESREFFVERRVWVRFEGYDPMLYVDDEGVIERNREHYAFGAEIAERCNVDLLLIPFYGGGSDVENVFRAMYHALSPDKSAESSAVDFNDLPPSQQMLFSCIDQAGKRVTQLDILTMLANDRNCMGDSTAKTGLAELRRRKLIDNQQDSDDRGYAILAYPRGYTQ